MVPRRIPIIPAAVLAACPDCFVPAFWQDWLETALALNTPGNRKARARMDAGALPLPCDDCTPAFESLMRADGRCSRPYGPQRRETEMTMKKKESEYA